MGDAGIEMPLPEAQLPISHSTPDTLDNQPREIHVLVTGFGPFKSFTNNPSYLIASAFSQTLQPAPPPPLPTKEKPKSPPVYGFLPSFLNRRVSANIQTQDQTQSPSVPIRTPNAKPYIIRIHTYPDAIHVAYAPTSVLIPCLLDPATNGSVFPGYPNGIDFDYIFHIGLASGRDSYTLETLAHRDEYLIPDVDDSIGAAISEMWKREDVPRSLDVGWDGADVLRRWKAEVERREAEGDVENSLSTSTTTAPSDATSSSPAKNESKQNTNDASSRAWLLQHGVLRPSSNTIFPTASTEQATQDQPQTSKPPTNKNNNLPSYTPIGGGGTTLRQIATPQTSHPSPSTSDTSQSTPTSTPRKSIVKLSRDAGRFLCEFILMCSLIQRYKQHQRVPVSSDAHSKLGKVAFLHVPNGTDRADVARGLMVAESAVRAVVGSWEGGWRNGEVYDGQGIGDGGLGGGGVDNAGFEERGTGDEVPR